MYYYQEDKDPDEYLYEENRLSHSLPSKPYIVEGGYVLPLQDKSNATDIQEPIIRTHNKHRPSSSDIYDEDHYTLARNSGIQTDQHATYQDDANHRNEHAKSNQIKKKRISTTKRLTIIFFIFGLLATGGVCAYIVMRRQERTLSSTTALTAVWINTRDVPPTTVSSHPTSIVKDGLILTDFGEDCQNKSLQPVESRSECIANTDFIRTYYPKYFFEGARNLPHFPKGCVIHVSKDFSKGYFNTNTISASGQSHSRAICKKKEECGWLIPTNRTNYLGCVDGTLCKGWSCCKYRGGRARCPKNFPIMCANKLCDGDYCCNEAIPDCLSNNYGGQRSCESI